MTTPAPNEPLGDDADDQGVPLVYSDEPVAGWRASNIVVTAASPPTAFLVGVHHRRRYGVEAHAVCTEYDHAAPATGCHCGLHCWPERAAAEHYQRAFAQHAVCQVELFGEVVCHGDLGSGVVEGYRGAHMRTLAVEFSGSCAWCGGDAVRLVPRGLPPGGERILTPACVRCTTPDGVECATVAGWLGTEVRFAPRPLNQQRWWQRLLPSRAPSPSPPAEMAAALALAVGVFTLLTAAVAGLAKAGGAAALLGASGVLAMAASVVLRSRWGTRRRGVSAAVVAMALALFFPVIAAAVMTDPSPYPREMPVLDTTSQEALPDDVSALAQLIVDRGGLDPTVTDVAPGLRAVVFRQGSACYQVAVTDTNRAIAPDGDPDGTPGGTPGGALDRTQGVYWQATAAQRVYSPVSGLCPQALPLPSPTPTTPTSTPPPTPE